MPAPPDKHTCPVHGYGPHALDERRILRCAREVGGGRVCGRAVGEWMPTCQILFPLSRQQAGEVRR